MHFEKGHLYHIYNQGNNRQPIFFLPENYEFFLNKIDTYILPFADILAYCLLPNHFHLMIYINEVEVNDKLVKTKESGRDSKSHPDSDGQHAETRTISLNKSIGIMLASYTRAINNQQNWSGSLFRKESKAICLSKPDDRIKSWYKSQGITTISNDQPENQYPNICFNYILNNPVKHRLVVKPEDWEYSSYDDYCGLRDARLINIAAIKDFGLTLFEGPN